MTPDSNRAAAVWRRLTGMFGGDAVERKFGTEPPPEWVSMIARLKDFELERGVRRLAFSGKTYVPTLPEFLRLCREVRNDEIDGPQAAPMSHRIEGPKALMDAWDCMANSHLFGYIARRVSERQSVPRDAEQMGPFLQAKRIWALMMREAEAKKEIPPDHGRVWWNDFMANAQTVCDEHAAAKAA